MSGGQYQIQQLINKLKQLYNNIKVELELGVMNNNQQVLYLIQQMQTQNVTKAQASLTQLCLQDNKIYNNLLHILKDANQTQHTKTVTSSFLNNALCENIFKLTIQQSMNGLITILSDHSIRPIDKRTLERATVHIIDHLQQPMITQFRQLTYQFYKDQKLRDVAYMIIGCFCVPVTVDVQHIVYLTRMFFPLSMNRIILLNSSDCLQMVKEYNQILKIWIVAWDRLKTQEDQIKQAKKDKKNNSTNNTNNNNTNHQFVKVLYQIAQSNQLSSVIVAVYEWLAQEPTYICGNNQLYQINVFKQQAAELHIRALKFSHRKSSELTIFKTTQKIIGNIYKTLSLAALHRNILDTYECRDFVTNLIIILRVYMTIVPAKFKKEWRQLMQNVIFPMMKTDDTQTTAFLQSPQEYSAMMEDCCQKQTFGTIKSQACSFLQKICDKSQAITQQQYIPDILVTLSVQSIKNRFNIKSQNQTNLNYVDLQIALLILSVLSYRLANHSAKMEQLKQVFKTPTLLQQISAYERTKLYMFLSYNYEEVYHSPQQGGFWINVAFNQISHPTTIFCANDFIFNIVDQYYSDYFMQMLSSKILTNAQGNIWEAIPKFIKKHCYKISQQLMLEMLENIYCRLQAQIKTLEKQQIKKTINIIKLIQILATLAQQKKYCDQNSHIRNMLWKVMLAFQTAIKLDIQDQIVIIIYQLIKQQKKLSQMSKSVLPSVLTLFMRDQYINDNYYKIINNYIMKGDADIVQPIVKSLQTAFLSFLLQISEKNMKKSQKRILQSQLLILTQNLLAMHSNSITQTIILQLSSIMIRYMPINNDKGIDCKVNTARALNVLFLCHMIVPMEIIQYIYRCIEYQIYYNYDIRVLQKCITTQVLKTDVNTQQQAILFAQFISVLGNVISTFRKREVSDQNAKKMQKKYGKDNRLKVHNYKEYQRLLKFIDTPFQNQTKFQVDLSNFLTELRNKNQMVFSEIIKYISKKDTQLLCNLCQFMNGNLTQRRIIYKVIREKAPQNVVEIKDQWKEEMKSDSQDEDLEEAKRKRIQNKKKSKLKGKTKSTKMQ